MIVAQYGDAMTSQPAKAEQLLVRGANRIYGAWVWAIFALVVLLLGPLAVGHPSLAGRRRVARLGVRITTALTGYGPRLEGRENLPEGPCLVVANHASYLDGILLTGVLPPRFAYVIKDEMADVPLAGLLLRRLGALFVDRHNPQGSSRDARRILKLIRKGHSVVFFPEGGFGPAPGLLPFKLGAFMMAARFNLPVVPISIQGSRRAMPAGSWWPRPTRLRVHIHPPIRALGNDRAAVQTLVAQARTAIISRLDEPDLSPPA